MYKNQKIKEQLCNLPATWLVTGCAGFIGSNLVEYLLQNDQRVLGLDNFSTGHLHNLEDVYEQVSPAQWQRFRFMEGDIRNIESCREAVRGVDHVLHQAALGSVPRSLFDPATTIGTNVGGFLNMLIAARDENVQSFVYAASRSTYDDHPDSPNREDCVGKPLSPYAATTYANELYADVFARSYGVRCVGLRYFNVFGKRQDPAGAHAPVIPKWIAAMAEGRQVVLNGDGSTSRDFCYIANVVQANVLAALVHSPNDSEIYNVAVNDATSLDQLHSYLKAILQAHGIVVRAMPRRAAFRTGDIQHSRADIAKAMQLLGYDPEYRIFAGLEATVPWYLKRLRKLASRNAASDSTDDRADIFATKPMPVSECSANGAGAAA